MRNLLLIIMLIFLSGCIYNPTRNPQQVTVNVINNSDKPQKRFYYVRIYNFNRNPLVNDYQSEMIAGRFFELAPGEHTTIFNANYTTNFFNYTWDSNYDFRKFPPQLMVFVGGCNMEATSPTTIPYQQNGSRTTVTYTFYKANNGQTLCRIMLN